MGQEQSISSQSLRKVWGPVDVGSVEHLEKSLRKGVKVHGVKLNDYQKEVIRSEAQLFGKPATFDEFEALFVRLYRQEMQSMNLSESVRALVDTPEDQSAVLDKEEEECKCMCCTMGDAYYDYAGNLPCPEPDKGKAVTVDTQLFLSPHRLEDCKGDPRNPKGITLFILYGRRKSDWQQKKGAYGNHNPRFEPEGAVLEKYVIDPNASHSDLRYLLEARNDLSIYFVRWNYGAKIGDTFKDGDIVQTEREAWRRYD